MGRATLSQIKPVYTCQACGQVAQNYIKPFEMGEEYGWGLKGIDLGGEVLAVLICPRCSHYPAPMILEKYQSRVLEGHDINFH
jgi:hypothetical protein